MVCITSKRLIYQPINGRGLGTKIVAAVVRPLLHKAVDVGMDWVGWGRNYSTLTGGNLRRRRALTEEGAQLL